MARIDHAKGATGAGLELPPTEELLFGEAAAGTLLMQADPAIVLDLPLRAAAWEDKGEIWLAASDPAEIGRRNGIAGKDDLLLKMRAGVDSALLKAVSPW
ncbi:MAG: DUF302 domain-containing protein [Terrimicrobiaceae bacterium]|nr:DUF302 domain-containing protein [Terrimicrobiaceae bacterium]